VKLYLKDCKMELCQTFLLSRRQRLLIQTKLGEIKDRYIS
jgi:hypothetical protein